MAQMACKTNPEKPSSLGRLQAGRASYNSLITSCIRIFSIHRYRISGFLMIYGLGYIHIIYIYMCI